MESNNKSKPKLITALSQFILVLAGGLIGVLGNQFFFERNRRLEVDLELKKQLFAEQLPLYNRIINFTYYYTKSGLNLITTKINIEKLKDPFGLIYARDTTYQTDTIKFQYPSFVSDTAYRIDLYEDFSIIKKNKDKIDRNVWRDFMDLIVFLENHPLPRCGCLSDILKSDWINEKIYEKWGEINAKLYLSATEKLNNKLY